MEERCGRYVRTLWVLAALFKITQYLCAAILTAGKLANDVTFRLALESLGPFLPVMSLVCLLGGLLFVVAELAVSIMNRKKK